MTIVNTNAHALTPAASTDTLPSGLTIATASAAATTCAGSFSATAGIIKLAGGTLPATIGCTVTVTVSAGSVGAYSNQFASGAHNRSEHQQCQNGDCGVDGDCVDEGGRGGGMVGIAVSRRAGYHKPTFAQI